MVEFALSMFRLGLVEKRAEFDHFLMSSFAASLTYDSAQEPSYSLPQLMLSVTPS